MVVLVRETWRDEVVCMRGDILGYMAFLNQKRVDLRPEVLVECGWCVIGRRSGNFDWCGRVLARHDVICDLMTVCGFLIS